MIEIVKEIKLKVKSLPCLVISDPLYFKIIETDALEVGFGGVLKQEKEGKEQIVKYHSGVWNET